MNGRTLAIIFSSLLAIFYVFAIAITAEQNWLDIVALLLALGLLVESLKKPKDG